jgi:hypothetical protein
MAQPAENAGAAPNELFHNVGSLDFLGFDFGGKAYKTQLEEAVQSTGKFCAVTVEIRTIKVRLQIFPMECRLVFSVKSQHFNDLMWNPNHITLPHASILSSGLAKAKKKSDSKI